MPLSYWLQHNFAILCVLFYLKMMATLLYYVYTGLFYLAIPWIGLRLYWKGRRLPAYRSRIKERFALNSMSCVDVWLHAVSLGEVIAATPLIEALLSKQQRVLVTTMTPTGSHQVITRFGTRVSHQYVPYDLPCVLRRFYTQVNPSVVIIMETELWPNLIAYAKRFNIPIVLMNARISDKAFVAYRKARFFFKPIFAKFHAILAQSDLDAERFIALGALKSQVHAFGNMKFDLDLKIIDRLFFDSFKTYWGRERTVLIAASTHEGEERNLLMRLKLLQSAIPDVLLLVAPRHPERFKAVYDLSCQYGFKTGLRSKSEQIDLETDVVVLDCLGELLGFYQSSDYAFVGGSLVPVGGHNVLEPIAMGVPVFTGSFMNNSKTIVEQLLQAQAIQCFDDADALFQAIITMHHNPWQRTTQVENATAILNANRGTVARSMDVIRNVIARVEGKAV